MMKWLLKQLRRANCTKLELNVQLSRQMRREFKNSSWNKCGSLQMELSEIISEELSSESQFSLKTFQDMFQDGQIQLSLEDMLSEINIELLTLLFLKQENLKWFTLQLMDLRKLQWKYIIIQEVELWWECIILMNQSLSLPIPVSSMLFKEIIHFIWVLRIQFLKNMMEDLKIFLKLFTRKITKINLKPRNFGMNIDWLMIWSHTQLNRKVDLFGLVRIMMEMCNQM